jgi:exocyst complex component 4
MLDNLPHDQAFSQLIITQIMTYYDKCYGWYKGKISFNKIGRTKLTKTALVARSQPHPQSGKRTKLAAALTDNVELKGIIDQLLVADDAGRRALIDKVCFCSDI